MWNIAKYLVDSIIALYQRRIEFQINAHHTNPVMHRKRRLNLQPESIDKLSIVCFPLAFTFFNVSDAIICSLKISELL